MHTRTVTVGSSVGLHARPASLIAAEADRLGGGVTIGLTGKPGIDASSSLLLMTLGAGQGTEVDVAGEDESAVDAIAAMVAKDLDA